MFDGIEMDIIDMPRKVAVVADGVLPKSPLPEREVAIGPALEMKPDLLTTHSCAVAALAGL